MKTYPASVLACALISSVAAQTIVAPAVSDNALGRQSLFAAPGTGAVAPLSDIASVLGSGLPLWERGPFTLRPHAAYRFAHSSGLLLAPGEPLSTDTHTVTVGSGLGIGQHWHADYTGSWVRYSDSRYQSGYDQSAGLSGSYAYLNWNLGLSGAYSVSHPMLIEVGGQTRQETYSTGLSAHGQIGQRSFVDVSFNQSYRNANAIATAAPWQHSTLRDSSVHGALGQQVSQKFSGAAGVTVGYSTQGVGPDMTYTQPQVQANWTPTEKISVGAMAGWERRGFRDSNTGSFDSPVYSGSVTYHALDTTSLTAGVTQGISASYIGSAVTRSTGWNLGLQQRLFQILYGNLGYSQQRSRYYQTVLALPQERNDKYDTFSASLAIPFLQHGSASVFYQRSHNGSDRAGYALTSTSYGAEVQFSF